MVVKGKISNELIDKAAKADIVQICRDNGFELKDMGKQYQVVGYDSLKIFKDTNSFNWFSQGVGGNSIKFCQTFLDMSFPEAIDYLTDSEMKEVKVVEQKPKEPFKYYFENAKSFDKAYSYLVDERKIDKDIVAALHKKGLIKQDKQGRCIFVWGNNARIVGASVQVIDPKVREKNDRNGYVNKYVASNVMSNYGFNVTLGTPTKIFVFEAPVDMLSYWSLNKNLTNCMLVSMDGLKQQSVFNFVEQMYLTKGTSATEGVFFGVDNDKAGHKFIDGMFENQFKFNRLIPFDDQIPGHLVEIYKDVSKGELSPNDWIAVAAVHKALSNFLETNDLTNKWGIDCFYGENLKPKVEPTPIDVREESEKVVMDLKQFKLPNGDFDFRSLFKSKGVDTNNLSFISDKVEYYHTMYKEIGFEVTNEVQKDWNDRLKQEHAYQIEADLFESAFIDKDKKVVEIAKDEETNKYKANITKYSNQVGYFEADSAEEMTKLIKVYGFQAVDKEDVKKYKKQEKKAEVKQYAELSR